MVGVAWSAQVTRKLSQADGNKKSPTNYPVLAFYLAYAGGFLWLLAG
jgi:hypothetical protein